MKAKQVIHRAWLACFLLSVALLSFSQTYSQVALAVALPFFVADTCVLARFTLSRFEKRLYSIVALFLALEIVASLTSVAPLTSLLALRKEWLFTLIPLSLRAFRDRDFHKYFFWTLTASVTLIATYAAIQHYNGMTPLRPGQPMIFSPDGLYRVVGNFHNPLTFGNYLVVVSAFLIARGMGAAKSVLSFATVSSAVFGAVVSFFTYKRGPAFGLVCGWVTLSVFQIRRNRALVIGLTIGVVALGALLAPRFLERVEDTVATELTNEDMTRWQYSMRRTTIWRTAGNIIIDKPLLGVGAGNFEEAYKQHADSVVVAFLSHAHNDILNIAASSGIPACLVYLFMWFYMFRELLRSRKRSNPRAAGRVALSATVVASVAFFAVALTEVAFTKEVVRSALMIFWGYGLWGLESVEQRGAGEASSTIRAT